MNVITTGVHLLLLAILLFGQPEYAIAQNKKNQKNTEATEQLSDSALYHGLQLRNIGPFRGGRSVAVSGVIQKPHVYYMGSTGGGIWKTEDSGISWKNISDGSLETGSVGDIAVAESDPNVIYVGMGEHAIRGVMTTHGDGIYKSTDAGSTWQHLGLDKTRHISDVIVHPQNPDIVYVAAQGAAHGPTEERGIYKSTDGGVTWNKILYVDENTGASGLSMDMTNPRILYAAMWEHQRYPWTVKSGGPGSAIYKSTDSGESWEKLTEGLPEEMGKVGVSVSEPTPIAYGQILKPKKEEFTGRIMAVKNGRSFPMIVLPGPEPGIIPKYLLTLRTLRLFMYSTHPCSNLSMVVKTSVPFLPLTVITMICG